MTRWSCVGLVKMKKRTRVGQRHQSPDELYDLIKRLVKAVDREGAKRGALKAAVETENAKAPLHYVNAHRWMRAWRLIEQHRKRPGLLLEWLRDLGASRVFHLAALEDPVHARAVGRLPGVRRSLSGMSEAEMREAIQSRNSKVQIRKNTMRKPMGRKPRPAHDLGNAIANLMNVWERVQPALPRAGVELVRELAPIKGDIGRLASLARKLRTLFGLRSRPVASNTGPRQACH